MARTRVRDLPAAAGEEVALKGWLYNRRSSKKFHFLLLRDGSGIVQCIVNRQEFEEDQFTEIGKIPYESAIEIRGLANADERAPGGVDGRTVANRNRFSSIFPSARIDLEREPSLYR